MAMALAAKRIVRSIFVCVFVNPFSNRIYGKKTEIEETAIPPEKNIVSIPETQIIKW